MPQRFPLTLFFVLIFGSLAMAAVPAPMEPPAELIETYRALTDAELRATLNEVSDQLNQTLGSVRDQKRELAFSIRKDEFQSEEITAAKSKIASLRAALAEAEKELEAAVLALPEMKERADTLAATELTTQELQQKRAAVRHVLAERRPNKGPRSGAILPPAP